MNPKLVPFPEVNNTDHVEGIDPNHYLLQFTDEELIDVLAKRDEWHADDFLLAREILNQRGFNITDKDIAILTRNRMDILRKPEQPSQTTWIIIGYVSAFLGGLLGIFIGWHLASQKKTLPNGERIYEYNAEDRQHAKIIFYGSIISTAVFVALKVTRVLTA